MTAFLCFDDMNFAQSYVMQLVQIITVKLCKLLHSTCTNYFIQPVQMKLNSLSIYSLCLVHFYDMIAQILLSHLHMLKHKVLQKSFVFT